MKISERVKKRENCIWAFVFSGIFCALLAYFFDFYYELNDDMLMKDIVAGIYSGTPSGYNVQMLYPLSFCISLFYRIIRFVPWYGLFFLLCQFGCIYLITERLLGFFKKDYQKILVLLLEAGLLSTLLLRELIFVQYTVTAAFMAGTAAFLVYTGEHCDTVKGYLKKNCISIILIVLAYQMRTEMLLLVSPLVCVMGLTCWSMEKPVFTKKNAAKYFSLLGVMLAGMILSQGIHILAYGGADWKEFNHYFDERTELYDFQILPPYAEHVEFYEEIGITEAKYTLLVNYNFGMEEEINANTLEQIADYAAKLKKENFSPKANLKQAVFDYKYRTFYDTDYPWNVAVIVLYTLVVMLALCNKKIKLLGSLLMMAVVRSGLWLFILYRGRSPERITHSLYLMEFLILLSMLLVEMRRMKADKPLTYRTTLGLAIAGIMSMLCIWYLQQSASDVYDEYLRREAVNKDYQALLDYAKKKEDAFLFWDVYSSVKYSSKLMDWEDNQISNLDIMGGWLVKSPLTAKKYEVFGLPSMKDALLKGGKAYVVVRSDELTSMPYFENWIVDFYAEKGILVSPKKIDSIIANGREAFHVYRIIPES